MIDEQISKEDKNQYYDLFIGIKCFKINKIYCPIKKNFLKYLSKNFVLYRRIVHLCVTKQNYHSLFIRFNSNQHRM